MGMIDKQSQQYQEALAAQYPEKLCANNCSSEPLPRDAFNRNAYMKDGLQAVCRACQKSKRLNVQRRQAFKEANPLKQGLKQNRKCLKCLKLFASVGPHNRICHECKKKADYSEADYGG